MSHEFLDQSFAEPAVNIIRRRWPHVWEMLSTEQPTHGIEILDGAHCPSFVFSGIQLASAYNPEREAAIQAHRIYKDFDDVYVYGVGVGYIPRYLTETSERKLGRIHVYILNKSLFLGMLSLVDQSDWLADERIELHLPVEDTVPQTPFAITTPCIHVADADASPLSQRLWLESNLNYQMNKRWKAENPHIMEQVEQNAALLRSDGCVSELFGLLAEKPSEGREVMVVGSGPSLDKEIGAVQDFARKGGVVVAASSALKTLVDSGINPDVVIMMDANRDAMSAHINVDLNQMSNTILVYFPVVHHDVLTMWPYKRLVAYGGDMSICGDICKEIFKESLFVGGSVLHPAVDLAVKMGAERVYLVGADLSYAYGKTHAQANFQSQQVESSDFVGDLVTVKNGRGGDNPTSHNLLLYLRALESYIQKVENVEFINMSRDGAQISGTTYGCD